MRIAVWHNLPSGGGKRALYYHVRGLIERGHEVESWCPSTADQAYLPLGELIAEHVVPFAWEYPDPNDPSGLAAPDVFARLELMDQHCRHCADEINAGGFDIFFANTCMFFRTTSIGRHVAGPKVLYLQEPYRWLYEAMPQLPWLAPSYSDEAAPSPYPDRDFLRNLTKVYGLRVQVREEVRNARAFDRLLVNSCFSRESVLRAYGLDAAVCYLGVDTNLFTNLGLPREPFAVGIGAFVPEKNIKFLLHALAAVEGPRPTLVWIGNVADDTYTQMQQLAESLQVPFEPKLAIADSEVVGYLNRASLMLYAPRLEPFGFAPLEANACGTPVIAVAEGGVRETVLDGHNGMLVDSNPRAMAAAIQYLMEDQNMAQQLGQNGMEWVRERWDLSAAVDRLENALTDVLAQSTRQ